MNTLLKQTGIAALYGLLIYLDNRYSGSATISVSFEPASGLALAVILIGGMRYAWSILVGAILGNLLETPFAAVAITSVADTLEALAAAWLFTHIGKLDKTLGSLRDYLGLISFSALSTAVAGNLWCVAMLGGGYIQAGEYLHELMLWWLGDTLGAILVAPLVLVWWRAKNEAFGTQKRIEAILLLGLMFFSGQVVFFGWFHDSFDNLARGYMMFLFVVWAAARFGTQGAVTVINLIGVQALMGPLYGTGYFSIDANSHMIDYWLYMTVLSITGMALATFISGRDRSEVALLESEKMLREAQALAHIGHFKYYPVNGVVEGSDELFRIFRLTRAQFQFSNFVESVHPDDRDYCMASIGLVIERKGSHEIEHRLLLHDGTLKWVRVVVQFIAASQEDQSLLVGTLQDISRYKQAENSLLRNRERLRAYLDNISDIIWVVDANLNVAYVSSGVTRLLGALPEELVGQASALVIHPDDMGGMADAQCYVLEHPGESRTVEHRIRHKDGSWIHVESTGINLLCNPAIDGVLITMRDMRKRKLAEDVRNQVEMELRKSEGLLQSIINNATAVIFLKDMDGRYLLVNSLYEKLFKTSNAAIRGKTDYDLFPPDIAGALVEVDQKVLRLGVPFEAEERVLQDDGIHTYISVKFPLREASGNVYAVCGIATDITERKADEQRLRDLTAHVLDVREEEKKRIAREIHDELGGLLATLNIDTYWLSRRLAACADTVPLVERLQLMSQRIEDAVRVKRRILDGLRPAVLDDLWLLAAIEWVAGDFYTHTGIECKVKCIEDEDRLDKQRSVALFRILQEALTNVMRHSGASMVEIEYANNGNEAVLTVGDNGCGMAENHKTASKSYGMLGMNERVKQLGGEITFGRSRGGGLRVEVILPLTIPA